MPLSLFCAIYPIFYRFSQFSAVYLVLPPFISFSCDFPVIFLHKNTVSTKNKVKSRQFLRFLSFLNEKAVEFILY